MLSTVYCFVLISYLQWENKVLIKKMYAILNIWFQQRGGNSKKESNRKSRNKNTTTEMKHAFDRGHQNFDAVRETISEFKEVNRNYTN